MDDEQNEEEAHLIEQIEALKRNKEPCPQCHGKQLEVVKKGFSPGFAIFGGLLAGAVGMEKLVFRCKNCGYKWEPTEKDEERRVKQLRKAALYIGLAILIFILMNTLLK